MVDRSFRGGGTIIFQGDFNTLDLNNVNKISFVLILLLFASSSAYSQSISINAGQSPYNQVPAAQGINTNSMSELRMAAGLGLVGMYRTTHGPMSVPVNSVVEVTYQNGSKEKLKVVCLTGSTCVQPIPGTQQPPPSGGSGGSGGILPPWYPPLPPPGCYGEGCGTVEVGELEMP